MELYKYTQENVKEGAYIWGDIDMWIKKHLQWRLIKRGEDNMKLAEGIQVLNFGSGHACGMLGLHINMQETRGLF